MGTMPPKMSAHTPMTRPRISSGTLVWMRVLDVDMKIIMPKEPIARKTRASDINAGDGEEKQHGGKEPDAAEDGGAARHGFADGGADQRADQGAEAAGGHQHAVAGLLDVENIAGVGGHQDAIGPAEDADGAEEA